MSRPANFRPRSVEELLASDVTLSRFTAQARRLGQLQELFHSITPLARHARVANIRTGRVVIHAENGGVATKLRHLEQRLLAVFQKSSFQITGIDIRLQPGVTKSSFLTRQTTRKVGEPQKQALTLFADGLPADSELREAVERLLQRIR